MLKDILKLEGTKQMSKEAQNGVNGGIACCLHLSCPSGQAAQVNPLTGVCFCVPA